MKNKEHEKMKKRRKVKGRDGWLEWREIEERERERKNKNREILFCWEEAERGTGLCSGRVLKKKGKRKGKKIFFLKKG